MTALQLFAWICAALALQLGLGIGWAIWRWHAAPRPTAENAEPVPAAAAASAAWPGWREFRVVRRAWEDEAHSQCSFYLAPLDGAPLPPFKPGQYLTFSLPITQRGGEPRALVRCYSLSDAPEATQYRVTIKRVPAPPGRPELPPGASSNHFHDQVREGTVLQVKAPSGHFFIEPDAAVPAVLIAGGIGITPMISMLRWCLAEQPTRAVHLYYGLRNGSEHAFKSLLEALAQAHPQFHLHVAYSRPEPGEAPRHVGRIDVPLLQRTLPHGRHQFYVCGPPAMMDGLVPALAAWGVPEHDIHYEAFGPASPRAMRESAAPTTAPLDVRLQRSGRTLQWSGQEANLLDFAERHGVAADSGCRSGGCGACETRLVSGTVRYARAPDHDVAPGHCLLCQATPGSALVLDL